MALNTSVEPFIQKMLMPSDPKALAQGLTDAVSGFVGAYLARKDVNAAEDSKPADQQAGTMDRIAQAFNAAPGKVAEGATAFGSFKRRMLANELHQEDRQISIDDALQRNAVEMGNEVGKMKTSTEIFDWVRQHAALTATPFGQKFLGQIEETGKRMAAQELTSQTHIEAVAMAKAGFDATNPADKVAWRQQQNEDALRTLAGKEGKDVTIESSDFDANGNWLPGRRNSIYNNAVRSEKLQSAEEVAAERAAKITANAASLTGKTDDFISAYKKSHAGKSPPDDLVAHFQSVATGMEARASAAGSLTNIDYKELSKQKDQIDKEARKAESELDVILLSKKKSALAEAQSKRREITRLHEKAKSISDQIGSIRMGSSSPAQSQEAPSFSPGTRVIQNGVTYEFDENGQPQPVK